MIDDLVKEFKDIQKATNGTADVVLNLMYIERLDRLNRKMDDLIRLQARKL